MKVRDAIAADMDAVSVIYGHSILNDAASFEIDPPDALEMTRRWEALHDAGYPYLVACDDAGQVTGFAYVSAYRPRPAYAATVEDSVYVSTDHRRKGVAQALVEALIAACRARDFKQMIAVIGDSQNVGSIALHQALGFRTVGTLEGVGRKFDRWVDVVLMQKTL